MFFILERYRFLINDMYDKRPDMMFIAGSLLSTNQLISICKNVLADFNIISVEQYNHMPFLEKEKILSLFCTSLDYYLINSECENFDFITLNECLICKAIQELCETKKTLSAEQIIEHISVFDKYSNKEDLVHYVVSIIEKYSEVKYFKQKKVGKYKEKYFSCIESEFKINNKTLISFTFLSANFVLTPEETG